MKNELYNQWKRLTSLSNNDFSSVISIYKEKDRLQRKYAWGIPSPEAITKVASFSPLIEIGSGRGYWGALLRDQGADILCYDESPPDQVDHNHWAPPKDGNGNPLIKAFTEVLKGGPQVLSEHSNRVLFLCWPPYATNMAYEALKRYRGDIFIYVGEPPGGCTGCDLFHEFCEKHFEIAEAMKIPKWAGLHDYLGIFRRKR